MDIHSSIIVQLEVSKQRGGGGGEEELAYLKTHYIK
jgi:hypothetical protein